MISRLRSFLRSLLKRSRLEGDIVDELEFHLGIRTSELMTSGLTREEAQRRARLEFGAVESVREQCREVRGISWVDELGRNIRFALRILRKSPAFAISAILTLGLCIGANTAVFSIINAVFLRPLPYPEPERLFLIATSFQSQDGQDFSMAQDGLTWELMSDHLTLMDRAPFSAWTTGVNLAGDGRAQYVRQQRIGAGYFRVLGVTPLLGREFTPKEDRAGAEAVVILKHTLWQRLFDGDVAALGRTINLRGEPHTVIGVMPPDLETGYSVDLWTPLKPSKTGEGSGNNYRIAARIHPDISREQADSEVLRVGEARLEQLKLQDGITAKFSLFPFRGGFTEELERPLFVLWAAVALVLLIGCVNIAGLLLARSRRRAREIAIRVALGGGHGALIRQMLSESLVLAMTGGLAGIALGYWGIHGLEFMLREQFGIWQEIRLDGRVLAVTAVVSLFSSLLFGLFPALRAGRVDVRPTLGEGGDRTMTGASRWPRRLLVVGEVTLGVILLVGAGLLIRTFYELRSLRPGFDPADLLSAGLSLNDARYDTVKKSNLLFDRSLEVIKQFPGVKSVAIGLSLPYERPLNMPFKRLDGPTPDARPQITNLCYVTPGYFETLRIPLLKGRSFESTDSAQSIPVVIINEAFAGRYLSDSDPIGQRVDIASEIRQIVGLVGSVQQISSGWGNYGPLGAAPMIFMPASQTSDAFLRVVHTWFSPRWVVRVTGPRGEVMTRMRQAIASIDPQLPFASFRSMEEVMSRSWANQRVQATLLTILAGLALLLTAVGVYGLIANTVAERRREIGIRMALGSGVSRAIWAAVIPGVLLAVAGVFLGTVLAWEATRFLEHLVWGVTRTDHLTYTTVAILLLSTSLLASLIPSLQITRINPARTLREE